MCKIICVLSMLTCMIGLSMNVVLGDEPAAPRIVGKAVSLVQNLATGNADGVNSVMDATMRAALPASAQASIWSSITAAEGGFVAVGTPSTGVVAGYDVVYATCKFQRNSLIAKVVFDKSGQVAGLFFLPDTAPVTLPAGASETRVTFKGAGGQTLAGTLTMPDHAVGQTVGALVLIAGSGPVDRNGNSGPEFHTDLLAQLASDLADAGVATLRYDKRGIGESRTAVSDPSTFWTWDNYVGDAIAALRFLKAQSGVDPRRVGFAGHSEGGVIALCAASRLHGTPDYPAALVLLSTPGRSLVDVIHDQIARAGSGDLLSTSDAISAQIRESATMPAQIPPDLAPLYPAYLVGYLHAEFNLDLAALAGSFQGPVLVVQGGSDIQVLPTKDGPRLDAALRSRAHDVHVYYLSPNTSHNLKSVAGVEDPGVAGPIVPGVVSTVQNWVKTNL